MHLINIIIIYSSYVATCIHFIFLLVASIEFSAVMTTVNEDNGTVTFNLVRTGDLSENVTLCIRVTMLVNPAIIQRMCTIMYIYIVYYY